MLSIARRGCALARPAVRQVVRCSASQQHTVVSHPAPPAYLGKKDLVGRLLAAKDKSGKSFDQIAQELGVTNVYAAQLLYNQAQLKKETAAKLKKVLPALNDHDLAEMQKAPFRCFDPQILQEPLVYRLYEAITHNGEAIKALVNEKCGDGIMSAIDVYCSVDRIQGKHGEARVVVSFNGKFLPHVEQKAEDTFQVPGAQ